MKPCKQLSQCDMWIQLLGCLKGVRFGGGHLLNLQSSISFLSLNEFRINT
uniref:Uncharacterized protein n=1 Tax=Kalanchoe fedtschenkoi TaxID=63787 RepID=A0A7N0SWQ0_KALFE